MHTTPHDYFDAIQFIFQIFTAEWLNMAHIVECELTRIDYSQEVQQKRTFTSLQAELMQLHTWRRRCSKYSDILQNITEFCSSGSPSKWKSSKGTDTMERTVDDIHDLHQTFRRLTKQSEKQLTVLLGRISIEVGHQSVWEASYVTRITIAGLAFLPLSFVSSIFSMNGQFAVDSKFGWVYFVVAIPLAFMVVWAGIYRPKAEQSRLSQMKVDQFDSTQLIRKGLSY
jgi:Mg2+ and Co2+ transporter CorA